jgi:hypothetical protein
MEFVQSLHTLQEKKEVNVKKAQKWETLCRTISYQTTKSHIEPSWRVAKLEEQ